jgi:hypothetical protein
MAKTRYKVVGPATLAVDGNDYRNGDEFSTDSFTEEQAAALIEGGHLKAVNTSSTSSKETSNG